MLNRITTRRAEAGDLEILREFESGLIAAERPFSPLLKKDPVRYYDLEGMLSDASIDFVIAEWDGVPVGCGYARIEKAKHFYRIEHHAYLGMMYVLPEFRGKGINARVINTLKERVRDRNVGQLFLEVFSQNQSAIRAYSKAGFSAHILQMRMDLE
jgi:ribosomal protein S18 acetylase RimI-like enzyme